MENNTTASNVTNNLKIDVEILKRDMHQLNGLFERLDVTIEKLGEVSTNLTKMLAVHENRIEKQEDADKQLHATVELLFTKIEERRKDVDVTRDDFRKEIAKLHHDIIEEMKDIKRSQNEFNTQINRRVSAIEKWRWMIIGGAVLAGYAINIIMKIL